MRQSVLFVFILIFPFAQTVVAKENMNMEKNPVADKPKLPVPTYTIGQLEGLFMKYLKFEEYPVEDARIYINYHGKYDYTSNSGIDNYTLLFPAPRTFYFYAYGENYLPSDIQEITIIPDYSDGLVECKLMEHLSFQDWSTDDLIDGLYYDFYKDTDSAGNIVRVPSDSLTVRNAVDGWEIGSYGQRVTVQPIAVSNHYGDVYGPPFFKYFVGDATDCALSFLERKNEGDPANAYIRSTKKYPGPLEIDVYMCGQYEETNPECIELYTSVDGETWNFASKTSIDSYRTVDPNILHYNQVDSVYVMIKSASHHHESRTLIFDIYITYGMMGRAYIFRDDYLAGVDEIVVDKVPIVKRETFYDLTGRKIKGGKFMAGLKITEYEDGSRKIEKIIGK